MRDKSLDGVFSACNGKLSLESQDSIIYISDKSNLDIYVNKMGVYSLHIYDNSIVNIHCNVEAKIFIFSIKENQIRYSGEYKGIKLIKNGRTGTQELIDVEFSITRRVWLFIASITFDALNKEITCRSIGDSKPLNNKKEALTTS